MTLLAIFILSVAIYCLDWSFVKGEMTAYHISRCPECPTGMTEDYRRKYNPNKAKQEVIGWSPEFGFPEKYTNCVVVSKKNWRCEDNYGLKSFGFMPDGTYWDTEADGVVNVSRLKYLTVAWGNRIIPFFSPHQF